MGMQCMHNFFLHGYPKKKLCHILAPFTRDHCGFESGLGTMWYRLSYPDYNLDRLHLYIYIYMEPNPELIIEKWSRVNRASDFTNNYYACSTA